MLLPKIIIDQLCIDIFFEISVFVLLRLLQHIEPDVIDRDCYFNLEEL